MNDQRKKEIIEQIKIERRRLEKNLAKLSNEELVQPGVFGPNMEYSVKDILSHLVEWEQMCMNWYQAGLKGDIFEVPAPGITWRNLKVLNRQIFEKNKNKSLEDVKVEFEASYKQILEVAELISVVDFFELGRFEWMGEKENMGGYIRANTGNHYRWAKNKIRKWLKEQKKL
ncbi:MAG: ClbS/DfsB family four-helix bundle protein [Candidatus Hodarchaeales archaeon]|jgi:hypothetical protein